MLKAEGNFSNSRKNERTVSRYFEDTKSLVFWFEDGLLDDEEVDISLDQNE